MRPRTAALSARAARSERVARVSRGLARDEPSRRAQRRLDGLAADASAVAVRCRVKAARSAGIRPGRVTTAPEYGPVCDGESRRCTAPWCKVCKRV